MPRGIGNRQLECLLFDSYTGAYYIVRCDLVEKMNYSIWRIMIYLASTWLVTFLWPDGGWNSYAHLAHFLPLFLQSQKFTYFPQLFPMLSSTQFFLKLCYSIIRQGLPIVLRMHGSDKSFHHIDSFTMSMSKRQFFARGSSCFLQRCYCRGELLA